MIDRYSLPDMRAVWSEEAKFQAWLDVEIAVCRHWNREGRIPDADLAQIVEKAHINVTRILEIEASTRHDVIAFTRQLAEEIGPASRFVHLGLTSTDVVDTAQGVRLKRAGAILTARVEALHATLTSMAREHAFTPTMGRTHGMHAEPTTFGLKVLVWREEIARHARRLAAALADVCVGKISGAVGTAAHTGIELEEAVCAELGIGVAAVSTQVLQRDRHAHFVATLATIGATLEKIATEIRHLQRPEVGEAEEPFGAGQKGSSAMPHKRNPIQCEQVTGLARVLRGYVVPALEDVALWHERDISHSSVERVILPDACMALDYMLDRMNRILGGLVVKKERMLENIDLLRGLAFSGQVLLRLVEAGLTREEAYDAVQAAAMRTWHGGAAFADELLAEPTVAAQVTRAQLDAWFTLEAYLAQVPAIFRRCGVELG